jgi:hypothetical protein
MRLYQRAALCTLSLAFILVSPINPSRVHAAQDCIQVKLRNTSVYPHTYSIKVETRCSCVDATTWTTAIEANGVAPIRVCSSHAHTNPEGYGEFWYHSEDQKTWTHATQLTDGQEYAM